jgi:hypothetical protein
MPPNQDLRLKVNLYLDRIKARLPLMSIDSTVREVKLWVAGAALLSDYDLRWIILGYHITHAIMLPQISPPDNKLAESVKKTVKSVIDGVDIKRGNGRVNIGISGLTAELKKGTDAASIGISWGGSLSVEAARGNFHFSGELSQDRWELKLSYPQDTAIPNLSELGNVFGQGEQALVGIIGATKGISRLQDIPKIGADVKPYIQPVKDAAEAAQGIAQAPSRGISVGFSLGSPTPLPGQTGMPGGIQGKLTATFQF